MTTLTGGPDDKIVPQSASPLAIDLVPDSWGPKSYSDIADVALTRRGPDEIEFEVGSHFLLVLLTPQPQREVRLAGSRQIVFDAPAGSVEVIPAGASFQARWHVSKENILISLDPARMADFAAREFDAGRVEMQTVQPGMIDRTAAGIAALMRDNLARPEGFDRLYVESLNTALMLHFIRSHSSLAGRSVQDGFRGGLAPRTWRDMEDFIRENLASDMALATLADRAGLSYSHFLRAFRQTAGVSPHRYIMLQRANLARELAAFSSLPLKQIALRCGFSSQSHMTTVMKALLSLTPGQIRRQAGIFSDASDS
ncbi:AraC family transcriptional regulator [Sandaracinobacter sp. RS1-74]|uniref:helix-turn-helix domain-containing protein n=1 Tax=Sandaracinobacteroides sayramensis TaxID=2913411 RepID=UPI001EDC5506|nr:AraC family transcriptional regulator [Sandaracinobacteroides sayramensis]MCG2839706.1 AraC family transcriptional regulator [Sandaracinobacteroides sayramensis]